MYHQEAQSSEISIERSIGETEMILNRLDDLFANQSRNIDDREWLMAFINFSADRDQFLVQMIYENLKYRNWSPEEQSAYISHFISIDENGHDQGLLIDSRKKVWKELSYLLEHSVLLQDTPWMVRDFYDEQTEFNYWYLIYTAAMYDPQWMDPQILPFMLELIPEDRITAVTYLWIKSPQSLCSMESEINRTGFPWNKILYLMEMNTFLKNKLADLSKPEYDFWLDNPGCIF
ncbi:hypothetical protein EXM22_05105 [Oceanispirochaeta crateris]|uniref:Uncharacterized protein n=1 Tax=Oceanispirochaeta crateris TaxID=2518645 RepID=A0A5C1QIV9_9SPIO|nr:hypothetical protein [Oceanispirochaeta crateris]QEN07397.1 hypothetical protein EXM22_05105 [Oceanispirochaeta crateris]